MTARREQTSDAGQKMALDVIRRVSLRTRLALLAAFALAALLVALFVAWRLARATETFALRQAESALHAAARDLARAFYAHPSGYQTIEEAAAPSGRTAAPRGKGRRERPLPPHVETLFAAYGDPLARLTAITLHRSPDMAGGFYRAADAAIVGHASPADAGTSGGMALPPDVTGTVLAVAKRADETGAPATSAVPAGSDRIIVVAYPVQAGGAEAEGTSSGAGGVSPIPVSAAWTMRRLSNLAGVSDKANLAALAALILSIVAVGGLAFVTVRDLRSGVSDIERGLAGLSGDLGRQITSPRTPELARITGAVNRLADTLRLNLARQSELEQDLRRSERLSALGRLVAGVAHEVRNPLAAIKLKVQMARRAGNAPANLDDTFRVVTEEIDRLDALVRRLLELGRTQQPERSGLDLGELVMRRAALFDDVAGRAGVKMEARVPASPLEVEGDGERLAQVIDNLIQNALDAMTGGGRLVINCEGGAGEDGLPVARLGFEDTGPGVPPEDRERIFEPFFTAREAGTGLGLAIAREIVEAHGGSINVAGRAGGGAFFLVELPQRSRGDDAGRAGQRSGNESGGLS